MANTSIKALLLWRVSLFLGILIQLFCSQAFADMGRLEPYLQQGFSDGWRAEYIGGDYWLENKEAQGAIRYYYADYDSDQAGRRSIAVRVKMTTEDPQARVGLVYGYDAQTRAYYLILLGPDGQLEVIRRDASGFNLRMSSSTGANVEDFTQLQVQESGNEISLRVNGRDLGSIGNDSIGKGSVGIAAIGLGRFGFSNYRESVTGSKTAELMRSSDVPRGEPSAMVVATQQRKPADITWFPIRNSQTGETYGEVPLPSDWRVTEQEWTAPGGVVAKAIQGEFLNGVNANIDQIIEGKLLPLLQKAGNHVLGVEDYPAIARYDSDYSAQLWTFAPTRDQHTAKGIVYSDDQNAKGVLVVHFKNSQSQFGYSSFYSMHALEGPKAAFDARKQEFLDALANQKSNPEQIAAYNRREQQKAASRSRDFNAQQRQKQQQFDSWMATQRQSSSSALDSGMDSWRRRQGMIDSGHQRQIDGIGGNTQAYDPSTGQTWQVEDGYNRYYMNSFGEYIPTDDQFYNPNMDPAVNNQQWNEVTPNYYGQ